MIQNSTYKIKLNPIAPLTQERVTAISFELRKLNSQTPIVTKELDNGIELEDDGWLVTLESSDLNFTGHVDRRVKFTSDSEDYTVVLESKLVISN